jgi:hypothetical protein
VIENVPPDFKRPFISRVMHKSGMLTARGKATAARASFDCFERKYTELVAERGTVATP